MNLVPYFFRRYSATYDCKAFACDVWRDLTGDDLAHRLTKALSGPLEAQTIAQGSRGGFRAVAAPVEPCLVLMLAPRSRAHVGVWIRGKVFHLHEGGVEHSDLEVASRSFKKIRFIVCKHN